VGGEHLESREGQDGSEAVMEEAKFGEQVGKKEIERSETHDGHDVRGVGKEWVAGDGEDGGNGVQGEDNIREFDGEQSEEEDSDHAAAVFADEELVLAKADRMDAGDPLDPAGCGLDRLGRGQDEANGGDEQDGGEEVTDPLEAGEEAKAGGDEGAAHHDGAGYSPKEDLGLAAGLDVEDAKKDKEDEEIVDGERLFDGVAGKILGCTLAALCVEDEDGEGEGGCDPEDGGGDGSGVGLCSSLTARVEELHPKQGKDEEVKTYPVADGGCARHLCLMLQARGPGCMGSAIVVPFRRRDARRCSSGGRGYPGG
jgi:hypothetical protein